MSDPNAVQWEERRSFNGRLGECVLHVWGSGSDYFWSVGHWDSSANQEGTERSLVAAKWAAEKCARAWLGELRKLAP